MDIDEMDLVELFQMIDTDGSGTIEAPEFIKPLSRWVHEPRQAHDVIFFVGSCPTCAAYWSPVEAGLKPCPSSGLKNSAAIH